MRRYFTLLDGLRFFAACWVMNFHYLSSVDPHQSVHWYRYGNLGVQLFFIISGFVIVQSLKGKSIREFALGRFVRLFPLFWVLCTATYILMLLLPDPRYTFYVTDYARSMTMLGDVFNGIIGPATLIDPSYWTLTVEILFYAGIALFVHFFSFARIRVFLASWLVLSACAFALHVDQNFYVKLFLVRHAAYFVFGSALALIATADARTRCEWYIDRGLLCVGALYALLILPFSLPAYEVPLASDGAAVLVLHILFFVGVPALVYLSRFITGPWTLRILTACGGLTYPMYLLHQRIGNALLIVFGGLLGMRWFTLVVFFEILVIVVAYGLYVVDKRFRSWLLLRIATAKPSTASST